MHALVHVHGEIDSKQSGKIMIRLHKFAGLMVIFVFSDVCHVGIKV